MQNSKSDSFQILVAEMAEIKINKKKKNLTETSYSPEP